MSKPEPTGIDRPLNQERADIAFHALELYADKTGLSMKHDEETAIGDLLADIMHLCDRDGIQFDTYLLRARMHYDAEQTED